MDRNSASSSDVSSSRVAVIGGAGQMGSWFARYFTSRGFPTVLTDARLEGAAEIAEETGAVLSDTNRGAVEGVDLALVCVPIRHTAEVVLEVAPRMKAGAILAEVSSIKSSAVEALREASRMGVTPLSIHPLFGPSAASLEGKTIVVVPVVEGEREKDLTRKLFDEANILVSEVEEHDKAMAVVLSLAYFVNLALAKVLNDEDLLLLKRLAGTTFTLQLALVESVVSEELDLIEPLLRENRFTEAYLDRYVQGTEEIRRLIRYDIDGFLELCDSLKVSMARDPEFQSADERRYRAFEALKT